MALTNNDIERIKEILEPVNVKIGTLQEDTQWIKKKVGNTPPCLQVNADQDEHPVKKGIFNELRKDVDKMEGRVRNIALKVSAIVATLAALGMGGLKIGGIL